MAARGIPATKISTELAKMGDTASPQVVRTTISRQDIKELIDKEKSRLADLIPEAVNNFDYWVKNARMFHDKVDKDIGYKATTKILESHALVSGAPSESIRVTINQSEVILSPVIEKMLAGFMDNFSKAVPIEPKPIDVDYEIISEENDTIQGV